MKKIIIGLMFILFINVSYSQKISIELLINWKEDSTFYKKCGITKIPFLVIKYKNLSDSALYFFNKSAGEAFLPPLISSTLEDYINNIDSLKNFNFSKSQFNVLIGGNEQTMRCWVVNPDSISYEQYYTVNVINDILFEIYYSLLFDEINTVKYTYDIYYELSDINEKGLSERLRNECVFLEPKGFYEQSFCLIGFEIIGGHYIFSISGDSFDNYIYLHPGWDNINKVYIHKKMQMPEKIDKYFFYNEKFLSNKIQIKFKKYILK